MTATQHLQALYARRRANFLTLIDGAKRCDIAQKINVTGSAVTWYKSGEHTINEVRARVIEQAYGLAFGDLDK